jgi:hypothetical protein
MHRSKKTKKVRFDQQTLSPELQEAFINFLSHHSAKRLSRNLRRMMMEHMMYERAGQSLHHYETLEDLHALFELLDVAEDEFEKDSELLLNGP